MTSESNGESTTTSAEPEFPIAAWGTLDYSRTETGGYRLVVNVDEDLSRLMRGFLPKALYPVRPRYSAHITVVRADYETPPNLDRWGSAQDAGIEFDFDPEVCRDEKRAWLRVRCPLLTVLRRDLGLPEESEWTRPPDGDNCFHITVAVLAPR